MFVMMGILIDFFMSCNTYAHPYSLLNAKNHIMSYTLNYYETKPRLKHSLVFTHKLKLKVPIATKYWPPCFC